MQCRKVFPTGYRSASGTTAPAGTHATWPRSWRSATRSAALQDGWTVYQVWETLHAEQKIAASYNTFCNQVKRLIVRAAFPASRAVRSPSPPAHRPTKQPGAAATDDFIFSSIPNDEEIL